MELKGFTEYHILESLKKSNYRDSYLVNTFAKLLKTEFNQWDAYRYDIIDNQGNILDTPKTPQQKRAFGTLENIARKVKRALVKYAGKGNILTNLVSLFLMKSESIPNKHKIKREIYDELTNEEIEMVENIIIELKTTKWKLDE